jgi:hypothetical protein
MNIYTNNERTQKKYTIADALKFAERRLHSQNIKGICTDVVTGLPYSMPITLEKANELADRMVNDSSHRGI